MELDFTTIIGVISGFVTMEEAGRSWLKEFLGKPKKFRIDEMKSKDQELLFQIDKLCSELLNSQIHCITDSSIERIKEEYFDRNLVPAHYRQEVSKEIDELFEKINIYLNKNVSLGGKIMINLQQNQIKKLCTIEDGINDIRDCLKDGSIASSTKDFVKKFQENLFWDNSSKKPIRLSDVYIEPKTISGLDVLEEVGKFLSEEKNSLLFIEAVAGSGKSSLMYKLANRYGDETHYFLRMSDLDVNRREGLCYALAEYAKLDHVWADYFQSGKVLFLDGFDEVAGRLNHELLIQDLRKFRQKKIKIIITTRPNYLVNMNTEYEKIQMRTLSRQQISDWIIQYAYVKGLEGMEYAEYLEVLENPERYRVIKEVISIPVFLYIIVNKHIDISHIETQTQLFQNVFRQLLEDKVDVGQYRIHTQIAQCLGYFLQVQTETRFSRKAMAFFVRFVNITLKSKITEEQLVQAFESSFIKKISEGEQEREFYHKSIQDYFSACYLYERISHLVTECQDSEQVDKAAAQYALLLDKHNIKEEFPHLAYLAAQKKDINKEQWIESLQKMFESIIQRGIPICTEEWYQVSLPAEKVRITAAEISSRYRYICENHAMIMREIFSAKLYEKGNIEEFIRFAANDIHSVGKSEKGQFIWDFFYGQSISSKDLEAVTYPDDVLAVLLADVFATVRNIHLSGGDFKLMRSGRATGKFENCILENIGIHNTLLHELFLENTAVKNIRFLACRIEYARITGCILEDSTFFSSVYSCVLAEAKIKNCQIGNQKPGNPMQIAKTEFQNLEFSGVKFCYLQCDDETVFRGNKFRNCKFISCMGKNIKMEECQMDKASFQSFQKYHQKICKDNMLTISSDPTENN